MAKTAGNDKRECGRDLTIAADSPNFAKLQLK
jgi:hypothetical protein